MDAPVFVCCCFPREKLFFNNALLLSPPDLIVPRFGADSFNVHQTEAKDNGVTMRVYRSKRVALDIDVPKDVALLLECVAETVSGQFLEKIKMKQRLIE